MVKKFSVEGMSCSACALSIEKKLNSEKGVNNCSVSLMGKSMCVDFDENIISSKDIFSIVKKLGYTAFDYEKRTVKDETDKLKKRFFISLIFLFPLMYFSMGEMFNLPVPNYKINLSLQCLLAIIIIAINFKFYINGTKAIFSGMANMDTLVSLGSASAFIYSFIMGIIAFVNKSHTHLFFEASAMVLALVTLGKWLEELSKKKTGKEVEKLTSFLPETVSVLVNGEEKTISIDEVKKGDVLVLRAGDFVSFDGVVVSGVAYLDKSAITGESIPIEVIEGDNVISGSVVKKGYLLYRATSEKSSSLFARIIESVKNAEVSKAPQQKLADKIAGVFVPIVLLIAIIVFMLWLFIAKDTYLAFKYAICVLVVSCPCSLGLATPVAIMAVAGKSASLGVLFKDAESMDRLSRVGAVFLDKTATLTEGKPKVVAFKNYSSITDDEIKSIAYALEDKSKHPLADCVKEFCVKSNVKVDDFEYVIGKGIRGVIGGKTYFLGNFVDIKKDEQFIGNSLVIMSDTNGDILCVFAIFDGLKDDSATVVSILKKWGLKIYMITGDNEDSASAIAQKLSLDKYYHNVLPENKAEIVLENKKGLITAFVGDGINDAPALKNSDVGVAIGTGTDIAIECSDVVLVNGKLSSLIDAIAISKKTNSIIKGNLFWAFFYNVLAIPLAGGAFAFLGVYLTPSIASLCMSVSSLFVVLNALRIRKYKKYDFSKGDSMKIIIEGMMCNHCASKVKEILSSIEGVKSVEINLKKKLAIVEGDVDLEMVKELIEKAGYVYKGVK